MARFRALAANTAAWRQEVQENFFSALGFRVFGFSPPVVPFSFMALFVRANGCGALGFKF